MGYLYEVDPRTLASEWGQDVQPDETANCCALSLVRALSFALR